MTNAKQRAAFFIDGNNFYHSLSNNGVQNIGALHYPTICAKLGQDREVVHVTYYIGKLGPDSPHYGPQRSFLAKLKKQGVRVVLGRIEKRPANDDLSDRLDALLEWVQKNIKVNLDLPLYNILRQQISGISEAHVWVEKAVDVQLAVDLLAGAMSDDYDVAYILSADGDFTPAVEQARALGKSVFAFSLSNGNELGKAVNTYIKVRRDWFAGCYEP